MSDSQLHINPAYALRKFVETPCAHRNHFMQASTILNAARAELQPTSRGVSQTCSGRRCAARARRLPKSHSMFLRFASLTGDHEIFRRSSWAYIKPTRALNPLYAINLGDLEVWLVASISYLSKAPAPCTCILHPHMPLHSSHACPSCNVGSRTRSSQCHHLHESPGMIVSFVLFQSAGVTRRRGGRSTSRVRSDGRCRSGAACAHRRLD